MHPLFGLGRWSSCILGGTGLEAILEFSGNALHVSHTSSTSSLSPLSLLAPVVCILALATSFKKSRAIDYSMEPVERNVHCRILAAGYPHDEQVCFWM
jgi:hypothetical protein